MSVPDWAPFIMGERVRNATKIRSVAERANSQNCASVILMPTAIL